MKNNKIAVFIHKNDNIFNSTIKNLPLLGIIDGNNIYKWISYNKFEKYFFDDIIQLSIHSNIETERGQIFIDQKIYFIPLHI